MATKNKIDETVEKVEGNIESLTYSDEEQKIRAAARDQAIAARGGKVYGTNKLSILTGAILQNRATNSGVRERKYSSGAELAGVIDAYFHGVFQEQEKGSEVIPDIEPMADFLGVTRDTIMRWVRGEDNMEFVAPLRIAMNEIASLKKQRAMTDKVNGLVYLSDMQNNHGYISNQKSADVNINVRMRHELPSVEQLTEQMRLLPP